MPNVIKSLLVGIGFDLDKESFGDVDSGLDAIVGKATRLGAVVAGAFGIKALTADFAAAKDVLGKFAQVNSVAANDVLALGNALESEGGSLQAFMGILENINRVRDRLRMGEAGIFEAAGKAGFDASAIMNATNAIQAYLAIAEQYSKLDAPGQRNVRDVLGLDDASQRLLSQGRPAVEAQMAEWSNIRPITDDMTKAAAEFNTQMQKLNENIGGFADIIGNEMTRAAANSAAWLNEVVEENRPWLRRQFETASKVPGAIFDSARYYLSGQAFEDAAGTVSGATMPAFEFPDFESMYRKASGFISDGMPESGAKAEIRRGGFGAPLVPSITIPVILDGKTIEKKVIDVNSRMNKQAVDDLSSVEGG